MPESPKAALPPPSYCLHIDRPLTPMSFLRTSLTTKLFAAIAATAVLVVAIMALLVALSMREGFAQYLLKGELARFDALVQALAAEPSPDTPRWLEFADNPQAWGDFVHAHTAQPNPPRPINRPPPGAGLRPPPPGGMPGQPRDLLDRLVLLDHNGRYLAGATDRFALFERRAICASDPCDGAALLGYLGLSAPISAQIGTDAFFLRRQYASLALSALVAILISAGAAFLVARQLLIPIRRLELGAKTLASGNYAARMTEDRTDELGQLIRHYNALAATLEQTDAAEREWISNTSHELQTPLAVLRAQIEALQDGIRQPDAKTLSEMHAAMMRLSRLVQDLKTLSFARETGLVTASAPEDLAEIVRAAADVARPALTAKGITLHLDLPPALSLTCDRERIAQVIDNLLQNAARYTNAPGQVRLRLRSEPNAVLLDVEDTAPGAPDADLPRLFDRFYRAEASRSRAYGGSGLGLSVCKAIIEAHGGTIWAARSDLGGLHIAIRLPQEAR